jgi:hypothetical protein
MARRGRKSHLAEAINKSSSGWKFFWQILIAVMLIGVLFLSFLKK